jgi:two-component system sensor histidine kinase RegB
MVAIKKLQSLFSFVHDATDFLKFPQTEIHSENAKLIWIVRLRWAAISLFFFTAIPGYLLGSLNRTTLTFFMAIIGSLLIFNLLTQMIFIATPKKVGPLFICFQLALDLAVLATLLLMSGGFANPFTALFLLNAALGGVLIRGRFSWPFVVLCHAFLISLQIQFFIENVEMNQKVFWSYTAASHILLFSVWLVMRSLGSYLEKHFETATLKHVQHERQDRLRAVGALAAGFSHEFASPLNAAKLRLDSLERALAKCDTSLEWQTNAKSTLAAAQESIRSCEFVIHSMNSSQLDVREHNSKPINAIEFVEDIVESWKEEHKEADLEVNNQLQGLISVSPINLAQVMLNLLDNSFEANPKGKIKLELKSENDWAILSVDDAGPGFSLRVLERRGEPFLTTKAQGTGLGLYVSEIFVQSLGGNLSIENKNYEKGSRVTLRWPLQRVVI